MPSYQTLQFKISLVHLEIFPLEAPLEQSVLLFTVEDLNAEDHFNFFNSGRLGFFDLGIVGRDYRHVIITAFRSFKGFLAMLNDN